MEQICDLLFKIGDSHASDYVQCKEKRVCGASTVPHDILSEIFLYAMHQPFNDIDTYDSSVPTVAYLSGANPIKLGHVSSYWRSVALNTAKLWSTICIDHPKQSHINLTRLWLDRAGTHPLHITIKCSPDLPIELSKFSAIFQLALEKLTQWYFIDFEVPLESTYSLSRALKEQVKNLIQLQYATIYVQSLEKRRLKVKGHENDTNILLIDSIWQSIHASPVLKYVNWKNLYEGVSVPEHAPYKTLERLELDYSMDPLEVIYVLKRSPAMISFRAYGLPVAGTKSPTRGTSGLAHIRHSLKELSLTVDRDGRGLSCVFDGLTLPGLQKLHISYHGRRNGDWRESQMPESDDVAFGHFLRRSGCMLKDVWLKDVPYGDLELSLHLCSPSFQSVTRLRLTGTKTVTEQTVRLLTLQQNEGIIPSIKHLWLELEGAEITDGVVSAMVGSRWPQNHWASNMTIATHENLKEVHIKRNFHLAFGTVDIKELSFMAARGLRVSISPGTLHVAEGLDRAGRVAGMFISSRSLRY